MNNSQMKSRCPSSRFISRAYLVDYKFFYDGYSKNRKEAVANIVGSSGDIVWGGLFQINQDDLLALDLYEGYPIYYQRKNIEIGNEFKKTFLAWVYFREPKEIGKPSDDYRKIILQGATDCKLSKEYINNNL